MQDTCKVAMVDRRHLPLSECSDLFSIREQTEAATYAQPERRARTLTSRLLTKYLITHPAASEFRHLGPGELQALSTSAWAGIELLSGPAHARTAAVVFVHGNAFSDWSASSSHCGNFTASCIGLHRTGLDFESIDTRRPEFYTSMFSAEEHRWVEDLQCRGAVRDAAFTLLWCVKEAYLKASGNLALSVWAFPRWSVWFDGQVDAVLQPTTVPPESVRVSGGIRTSGFSQNFAVAARRVNNMMLALVQYVADAGLPDEHRVRNYE